MKKILIVDDQAEVRELVEITLKSDNYIVLKAKNGNEALDIVNQEKPDLILMDIMMPGETDGLKATQIIKSNPETREIYIIMLTAKGQKQDYIRGFEVGADDYFVKPFSPVELINKAEELLKE